MSKVKFLELISNNLKWNTHIQFLCSKIRNVFYMITSLRGDLSLFMLNIYIYVNCKISVFNKIWYNFMGRGNFGTVKAIKKQKRVLCSIDGLYKSLVGKFLKR